MDRTLTWIRWILYGKDIPVRSKVFAENGIVRLDNFPPLWVLDERERRKLDNLILDHW